MSLDKAIEHGKEYRKQWKYKKNYSKSVDDRCRNHGGCDWCLSNRVHKYNKKISGKQQQEDF